jgi:hypothetical protein
MEQIKTVTLQSVDYFSEVLASKTNKATKKLVQVLYAFERARSELDNAYHAVTEDTQFETHGHVYYGGRNDR